MVDRDPAAYVHPETGTCADILSTIPDLHHRGDAWRFGDRQQHALLSTNSSVLPNLNATSPSRLAFGTTTPTRSGFVSGCASSAWTCPPPCPRGPSVLACCAHRTSFWDSGGGGAIWPRRGIQDDRDRRPAGQTRSTDPSGSPKDRPGVASTHGSATPHSGKAHADWNANATNRSASTLRKSLTIARHPRVELLAGLCVRHRLVLAFDRHPITLAVLEKGLRQVDLGSTDVRVATSVESQRKKVIRRFAAGEQGKAIALCSDAMSEGLNLQGASCIVHLQIFPLRSRVRRAAGRSC